MALWSDHCLASPADLAACRALLRDGSRSFLAASRLLPRQVRDDAVALYAFCRVADDVIDKGEDASALLQLQRRLDQVYAGAPTAIPADRALADLVAQRGIPRTLLDALLEGFSWDAAGRRYDDLSGLTDYAVRVAGSVGAIMALLMGARTPEQVARACDLGVAMQLSNIARDVGEDARAGRLYLPRNWLREGGIDPDAWLERPVFNDALGCVVRRLLDEADALYQRADGGIALLPVACRPGIRAARLLYADIGRHVGLNGFDSLSARAVVPGRRKLRLVVRSFTSRTKVAQTVATAPLPEAAFLVAAVTNLPAWKKTAENASVRPLGIRPRMIWLINLLGEMERREGLGRTG